ncbi:MAG: diaminopimelate epimerase [Ilumatobacteraceae bacterium]
MKVTLTKHHGLGNDFLVLDLDQLDPKIESDADWSQRARNWCDRKSGIGADGLLLLGRGAGNNLKMRLFNQDGSSAEMSGNGIRCLVQAAYMRDARADSTTYIVETDAGERSVEVAPHKLLANTVYASVDMGPIEPLPAPGNWNAIGCDPGRPVMHLSVGNPHSVVAVDDVQSVNLLELGRKVPDINLEVIEPGPEINAITMRVHERGAGITRACGTGACASAWAAVKWGLVSAQSDDILVHMDGGDTRVRVHSPLPGRVTLVGPAEYLYDETAEMTI